MLLRCRGPVQRKASQAYGHVRSGAHCAPAQCAGALGTLSREGPKRFSTSCSYPLEKQLNTVAFPYLTPDPHVKIAVHGGYKIQAALIVHRVPIKYKEPTYRQQFREFREKWRLSTGNAITLDDHLLYMKMPFNFYNTTPSTPTTTSSALSAPNSATPPENAGRLEQLFSEEYVSSLEHYQGETAAPDVQQDAKDDAHLSGANFTSVLRQPEQLLTLLVWYPTSSGLPTTDAQKPTGVWTFPTIDREPGQSMEDVLKKLCRSQLGAPFSPYIPNFCPVHHSTTDFDHHLYRQFGLKGRQMFYYRGYWVPGTPNVEFNQSSIVRKFAWVPHAEVFSRVSLNDQKIFQESALLGH